MNKISTVLIIIILSSVMPSFSYAQDNDPMLIEYSPSVQTNGYYSNGQREYEFKDGFMIFYFENGDIKEETQLNREGKAHGISRVYYKNGNLKLSFNFKNNYAHGLCMWYFDSGVIKILANFENGFCEGECKGYYPSSMLMENTYYERGLEHGTKISYYENGNVKAVANYYKGILHGDGHTNYPSGKLMQVVEFHFGDMIKCNKY